MNRALPDLLDSDPPPSEFVYFIEGGEAIKIGYTTHLYKRFADLKTSSAIKLAMMDYVRAGKDVERELHRLLASERMSGEWFKASDKTLDLIYLISDYLDAFDDNDEDRDGRDVHTLTLSELANIVANPYHWAPRDD